VVTANTSDPHTNRKDVNGTLYPVEISLTVLINTVGSISKQKIQCGADSVSAAGHGRNVADAVSRGLFELISRLNAEKEV
jgi:hypothetical protein